MSRPARKPTERVGPEPAPYALFRDLCENAHDLIQSVAADGSILYANRSWREALGYSEAEVEHLNVFDVVHPESLEHCRAGFAEVMQGHPLLDVTFAFAAKDGRRIEVEGNVTCRRDGNGVTGTCGFFHPLTQEKELRLQLDSLFSLSLDLLCIAGTDGYFKQVNPAFETVLGYTREELMSRPFVAFVHPEDREGTIAEVQKLAHGEPVVDFQNRYRTRDGSYRWLAWRAAPLTDRGLVYAVARDVTLRKAMDEAMERQSQALARSNADLEQFAYTASHDMRAPLRAIHNLSEWIEEDLNAGDRAKASEHIATLRQRVRRMENLTDDLLRYYRAGHEREEPRQVDTARLIEDLTALLAPPPGFTIKTEGRMPVFVTARSPLELVLRNLIGNAIKHHHRTAGQVVVSCRKRSEVYEFSVTDDGPGIPAAHQESIFRMFQTLKPRDEVEGTGIGLSLVQRIVEHYGGRVRVRSREGEGATFTFTWPVTLPAAEDAHADASDR